MRSQLIPRQNRPMENLEPRVSRRCSPRESSIVRRREGTMTVRTSERRHSVRMAASYMATVRTLRNQVIARGRTANISEKGVLVVVRRSRKALEAGDVYLDLVIPADPMAGTRRNVTYMCRVVRRQELANLLGLGLEFVEKVS